MKPFDWMFHAGLWCWRLAKEHAAWHPAMKNACIANTCTPKTVSKTFSNSVSFYTVPVADTLLFHRPPKIKINYNENEYNCFSTYHAFLNDLVTCVVHCSACTMTDALSRWDDRAKHKQAFRIIKFCRIKDEVVADATFQQHTVSHWRGQTR